ncbi:MAG: DNA double-strand break repair nuclease NurA [Nitrososphaerota archaeon]
MFEEEKPSAMSKLPFKLQVDLYEHARQAASRVFKEIEIEREKLSRVNNLLKFRDIPEVLSSKDLRVGAVDGSSSPTFSDRLGYRIGVYAACYIVFDGNEIISDKDDETMEAGYMMVNQVGDIEQTRKILTLLMTVKEREKALRCIEKYDVDILLIDGSFYGFRTRCSEIKKLDLAEIGISEYKTGWELINHVLKSTRKLVKSGKAVGVIKRLRSCAIDGWILSKTWSKKSIVNRNDRSVLRSLMPCGKYFDYRDIHEDEWTYLHYSNLVTWYKELVRNHIIREDCTPEDNVKRAFEYVHSKLKTQIATDLTPPNSHNEPKSKVGEDLVKEITSRPRIHARLSRYAAPICLELGEGVDLDIVLSYSLKNVNVVTGIPFPIDLVDEQVSLEKEIAREFAEEIETRLLLESEISSEEVEARLEPLNPQKGG